MHRIPRGSLRCAQSQGAWRGPSAPAHATQRQLGRKAPRRALQTHALGLVTPARGPSPVALCAGPFLVGTAFWSSWYYLRTCNEELVEAAGSQDNVRDQVWGIYAVYRYLELTTDGPRWDGAGVASSIDWDAITKLAPTRSAVGLIYYCWSTLLQGIDNTIAFFPAVDIKPKLIKMGILESLEESLVSGDETVRLCSAYVVSRLVRNAQVARMVAARPKIIEALLELADKELRVEDGKFVGFAHCDSNTSAEVFVTVLDTINNLLDATVNPQQLLIGGSDGRLLRPDLVTQHVQAPLVLKLACTLRRVDLCNDSPPSAADMFSDDHITLYKRFFPRHVDDQVRRRMREVEQVIARFLGELSNDRGACRRLLMDREVVRSLAPLAVTEARNGSAYVYAVKAMHNVFDTYERALKEGAVREARDVEDELASTSLLVKSHVNREALKDALTKVADRDEASVGRPLAKITSVYVMRCYTSSMACLVAGGVYGLMRTPASRMISPLMTYSVTGVGAMLLNVLYGTYGARNWVKARTYIEDEKVHLAFTWSQVLLDSVVIGAILRRHPYSLVPMVVTNLIGHNSYPGTGLKRLDGLDGMFALN